MPKKKKTAPMYSPKAQDSSKSLFNNRKQSTTGEHPKSRAKVQKSSLMQDNEQENK